MKIAMIGTGVYSLAMAKRMAKIKENQIVLWTEDAKKEKEFNETKKIKSIFKNEIFTENISVSNNYEVVLKDAKVIFLMTSSAFIKETLLNIKPFYKKNIPIIIGTKGIETESKMFFSKLVKDILKTKNVAIIAGPSFAIDILNDKILALTVATKNKKIFKLIKNIYKDSRTTLIRTTDLIGVQLCSILKNIYAIGSGILNSLENPESTNAIYLTKVMKEVYNILYTYDANDFTFLSLAGFGDIIMTCSDNKSRNYTYGTKLASKSKNTATNYLKKNTVEGYNILKTIYPMLKKKKIKANILFTIYGIIYENKPQDELEKELLK